MTLETLSDATTIVLPAGATDYLIDPAAKRRPLLNEDDARGLTEEIQRTSVRLWLLVTEAHDRAAHAALGYDTWDDYCREELKMSPARSYQLLDTGHVMRELAAGGADISTLPPPPARIVAKVKGDLPAVRRAARYAVKHDVDPIERLRNLATKPKPAVVVDEIAEAPPPRRRASTVTCPACQGQGKVTRSVANKLRAIFT